MVQYSNIKLSRKKGGNSIFYTYCKYIYYHRNGESIKILQQISVIVMHGTYIVPTSMVLFMLFMIYIKWNCTCHASLHCKNGLLKPLSKRWTHVVIGCMAWSVYHVFNHFILVFLTESVWQWFGSICLVK